MDIGERILILMKELNLTGQKFAESISVNSSNITHIVNNRNKPSYQIISSIMKAYPDVSPDWLINGNGDIFRSSLNYMYPSDVTPAGVVDIDTIFGKVELATVAVDIPVTSVRETLEDNVVTIDKSIDLDDISDINTDANIPIGTKVVERKINKIVIFYSDNSFEEFNK